MVITLTAEETIEVERISNFLASSPNGYSNTTRKVAKAILLRGNYFCRGDMMIPKIKQLGIGIYKVYGEEMK